ncbi:MAG TPA: class I adenylate-forming enzyme family protein [Verrucomicrobiae bacterium]|nr:class I adenylate-forming enzyme family protein [Verrucomicrobiae bacterium]
MTRIRTLGYLLDEALRLVPEREALLQDDLTLTFSDLDRRCDQVASWVRDAGVRPQQRVALLWSNDVRYVEAMLGTIRAEAVAVPLNVKLGDDALGYVLEDAEAVGILAHPDLADRARQLGAATGRSLWTATPPDWLQAEPRFPRADTDPDAICFQPYTSGSTGRPKGVLLSHRGQVWNADVMRRWEMIDETERALVSAPVYHKNAGMTLKIFLIGGASVVVRPGFDPVETIAAIERYRCTYIGGVPAMFRRLLEAEDALRNHDVSSLRFATAGSADVPADLLAAFEARFGVPIGNGYGLTEGGPDVLISPRYGIRKLGSIGPPIPGCKVRLTDPADPGREVAVGETGELWTKNPGVTQGYHNLPELSRERIRDGWLATGDLMRRDADDYYYFVGRKDDLLNVGGENVYPKEVEAILRQHPAVADVAVVGVAHPVKGQAPVAAVVEREPGGLSGAELTAFFVQRGPAYAHPRRTLFVAALPLGATGKVDYAAVRRLFADPAPGQGGPGSDPGDGG